MPKTQAKTELLITLDEVAGKLGLSPEGLWSWLNRLGIEPREQRIGWAEWEVIGEADAERLMEAVAEADREAAELHTAYEAYLEDWTRQQTEAVRNAYSEAVRETRERQHAEGVPDGYAFLGGLDTMPVPFSSAVVYEIVTNARAEFERKHPKLTLEQFEKKWRKRR